MNETFCFINCGGQIYDENNFKNNVAVSMAVDLGGETRRKLGTGELQIALNSEMQL